MEIGGGYWPNKITKMADEIWDKNNWTNEDMERLLKTHKRTPYNPKKLINLKIVLDTNVLLVSISSKSRYRPILDAFLNEKFELCVTTDILME